jgi:hydrogenase maturation protease
VSEPVRPLVVVGVGNIMLHDDAIGVRVIEALREIQEHDPVALPDHTTLVDGGTLLMDLLHIVKDARGLILVDALHLGEPEGTVSVQYGDAIVTVGGTHGQPPSSVGELLAIARLMGWLPEPVALVGVEVTHTGFGTELSPVVAGALARAVDVVHNELRVMDEHIAALRIAEGRHHETTGAPA